MAAEQFVVLAGAEEQALTSSPTTGRAGFAALETAREWARGGRPGDPRLGPARPRRRLLPTGRKASFLARAPATDLPRRQRGRVGAGDVQGPRDHVPRPLPLIEGCLITAHAIESDRVFIYIRGEYLHEFEILRDALAEVHKAKLLGGVTIVLHRGAGAYICGEETALLESLEGKRGQPRTKPPFPPSRASTPRRA